MTDEELITYYVTKRLNGHSTIELLKYMQTQQLSELQRKTIVEKLEKLDKTLELQEEQQKRKKQIKKGFLEIIIGVLVFLFGCWLFFQSAQIYRIYILNFIVWGAGTGSIFWGIVDIIIGTIKLKSATSN